MDILLIAGGWSGEREVALSGARQIEKGLLTLGHHVTHFDPARDLRGLYEAAAGQEFAFINLHGSPGEDGLVQCLLERIGMPYQGSDSRASLLALNKAVSKQIFEAAGLSTPDWEFVPARHAEWRPLLPFPLVVKPNTGGSSLGVGIVASEDELEAYLAQPEIAGQDLLAETFIRGQELTCGVLEGCVLPPILIRPKSGEFFDYESKYVAGATEELCPAPIPEELTERLQAMARAAHDALGLSDYSRADFMVAADGTPYLLEVNTLPGMTATSLLPQEAQAVGLSFEQLLTRLIELGLRKKS
jgi:D-alanine-D-alanine ligase